MRDRDRSQEELILAAATLPEHVREALKVRLLTTPIRNYTDFTEVTQFILAHVLTGDIPVDAATVAKAYLELIFTAVAAETVTKRMAADGEAPKRISEVLDFAEKEAGRFQPAFEYVNEDGESVSFDTRKRRS